MPYELVNAVSVQPFRCEFCTANVAPFIDTKSVRPNGGTYHLCSICWRQVLVVLGAVSKIDHDAVKVQLASANDQIASLQAALADVDVVTAALTNAQAELGMLRGEQG